MLFLEKFWNCCGELVELFVILLCYTCCLIVSYFHNHLVLRDLVDCWKDAYVQPCLFLPCPGTCGE